MKKNTLFAILMCVACGPKHQPAVNQTVLEEGHRDTVPKEVVQESTVNWNAYLNKQSFVQAESDSSFFAFVQPTYALFVASQAGSKDVSSYQVAVFEKPAKDWIRTTEIDITLEEAQISDLRAKWLFTDINGDGDKDLLLKIKHDGKQNKSYRCFLQAKAKATFVEVDDFENIENPQYDSTQKVLTAKGTAHAQWYEESYQWEGSRLKFIKGKRTTMYKGEASEEIYYKKEN